MGQLFLIVFDAYSKWIEVYPTSSAGTRPDQIRLELRHRVETQQGGQKVHHDNRKSDNFPGPKWKKAQIESRTGPLCIHR